MDSVTSMVARQYVSLLYFYHAQFLSRSNKQVASFEAVDDLLRSHAKENCHVAEDRQRIVVRRRHIWLDVKRALNRPYFNDRVGLNVTFIGKPAQDAGGPTRELFRILWIKLARDGMLFVGPEDARQLQHNVIALKAIDFKCVGQLVSLALVYGGSAPHFFAGLVVKYIPEEPVEVSDVDDILDIDIRSSIHKVSYSKSV